MAEARLGVVPTPALQRAGFEVNTSMHQSQVHISQDGFVLFIPHPRFLFRNMKRRMWRLWNKVEIAFMPIPAWSVLVILSSASVWVVKSPSHSWVRSGWLARTLWAVDSLIPFTKYIPTNYRVTYLTFNVSAAIVMGITFVQRIALRQLLSYHGWLYERKEKSLKTKIWGFMLRTIFLNRIHRKLVAYQSSLPTLPLPNLNDTVTKYLRSVKCLTTDAEYAEIETLAHNFERKEGPRLQRYLRLKWLASSNYVSDWWLNYVYLRGRDSLCINSNWYGIMYAEFFPTRIQSSRAAALVATLVKIKRQLDTEQLEPQLVGGTVPLCMAQYEHAFSTTRIPGREMDRLKKFDTNESRHVAVLHRGRFFKLPVFSPSTLQPLTPLQLEAAIEGILTSTADPDPNEQFIPALTAANRTEWADIRDEFFKKDPFNRESLRIVESSLFVMCLDDEETPADLTLEGRSYLTGNGCNRWSDKSFCLVVSKNGKAGFHVEHAWGDAPTLAHLIEIASCPDEFQSHYDDTGRIRATAEDMMNKSKGTWSVYPAQRIRFHVPPALFEHTARIYKTYCAQIEDLDLYVAAFRKYGKRLCKKANCSPDAWIQMSMQLAYYRDQGCFNQTYESAMTRLFKEGRTETIRSASLESRDFVLAFENPEVPRAEVFKLLKVACEKHQKTYLDAMCGMGVDRHLFALYVVSVGKVIDSPFLQRVLSRKWKLSTSQVPTRQLPVSMHHPDEAKLHTPNGGFGPVADDGYGVSYCVWGEDMFYFNVSSKVSCPKTDSKRFHGNIMKALEDMETLVAAASAGGDKKKEIK